MRILVVDDEFVSKIKMHKIMESLGECKAVESGKGAIAAFKNAWENWQPFNLISLDISMPDMTGIEVLSKIKSMEKEKQVPDDLKVKIMMVTSHSDKGNITACIAAGCDAFVVKPFDKKVIIKKLEKLGYKFSWGFGNN
ncbi:putative Chemotaxis protein CheY [Candidatus Magnetomoraceae bacterium gMMP-15]